MAAIIKPSMMPAGTTRCPFCSQCSIHPGDSPSILRRHIEIVHRHRAELLVSHGWSVATSDRSASTQPIIKHIDRAPISLLDSPPHAHATALNVIDLTGDSGDETEPVMPELGPRRLMDHQILRVQPPGLPSQSKSQKLPRGHDSPSSLESLAPFLVAEVHGHCQSLPSLADCPVEVQSMWKQACATLPRVFDKKHMYLTGDCHEYATLSNKVYLASETKKNCSFFGPNGSSYDAKITSRFQCLARIDKGCAQNTNIGAHDGFSMFASVSIPKDELFTVPSFVGPEFQGGTEVFWSLRGSFSDIHIDHGMDVVASPVAKKIRQTRNETDTGDELVTSEHCKKIFFLYPPTSKNLGLLDDVAGKTDRLQAICSRLEGGMQLALDASVGLYMPSGCLHAVLTTSGGMMVNKDFVNQDTLSTMARWIDISSAHRSRFNKADVIAALGRWSDAAQVANLTTFAEAWKTASNALQDLLNDISEKEASSLRVDWTNIIRQRKGLGEVQRQEILAGFAKAKNLSY